MKAVIGTMFVVAALVAGSVTTSFAQARPTEKSIDDRVEARLNADATLKNYEILVTTEDGVVTLTGMVRTAAESARAARLANVTGVSRVNNNLVVSKDVKEKVKGTAGTIADKTKDGAEKVGEKTKDAAIATKEGAKKVGEKTKDGAEVVVDKTKEGLSKTGEVITDAWITSRISAKYVGDSILKDSNINVDTDNHVVTLRGTVMSQAAKTHAVAKAREVEGVRRVVDQLTIGPKK